MKDKILRIFKEAGDQFVSGEQLSKELNCSRTAVWKHIEELRKEGYVFEAARRSGYRLSSAPDMPFPEEIKNGLRTCFIGRNVFYSPAVRSTQAEAHRIAGEGAEDGTLVIADLQEGGKGRLGRVWHSPSGTGIWMSLLLRPKLELHQCPQLTLVAAVAVVEAIRKYTGLQVAIKWPNDILLDGKKICGILTELNAEATVVNYIIIGIGINVNTPSFPAELQSVATSLRIEGGQDFSRVQLVQRILERFESLYVAYLEEGFASLKERWESFATSVGQRIIARQIHGTVEGLALGIDQDGSLLIQKEDGGIEKVYSADIEIDA
jgi:BirA family transcriptional regulator, biotin operon repressor / biotin---[acetyl-CoA-carboxylase] ligase